MRPDASILKMTVKDEVPAAAPGAELTKEQTLTREDKIHAFDMLTWASLSATFMSGWQIVIPIVLFQLNSAQVYLSITSFFFLVVSLIMLYWSNRNFYILKRDEAPDSLLPTWHIEGTIYVISYLLIACYATFLIGIVLYEGYTWALLVAQGQQLQNAQKEAQIIIVAECLLIICDILILTFYIKYSYHLEFFPKHLPSILGFFLSAFIIMCSMTLGDSNYLKSYIGQSSHFYVGVAEGIHEQIISTCVIGVLVTFFFLYENRSIQQQQVPKVRFYFLPFLCFIGFGFFLIINSLKFLYYASSVNKKMSSDCKATLQTFSQNYINTIGCPSKYQTFQVGDSVYYNQDCSPYSSGIVWELDAGKPISQQRNQVSCLNLSCCHLVAERRSLNYKEFFLFSIMTAFIGWIAAGHCMDLACQNPDKIKAGPSIYTTPKYASQWILAIMGVVFGLFLAVELKPIIPTTQPTVTAVKEEVFKLNNNATMFPAISPLQSIQACVNPNELLISPINFVFDDKQCPKQIRYNSTLCNKQKQGVFVCLYALYGVFQLDPSWDSSDSRILGFQMFDQYVLQRGLHGDLTNDTFCAFGSHKSINKLIGQQLYVCQNPGKIANISLQFKQIERTSNFSSSGQPQDLQEMVIQHVHQETKTESPNRILVHKHLHADSKNSEPGDQVLNSSTLNTTVAIQYGSIILDIFDAENYQSISEAQVYVFNNVSSCMPLDQSVYNPIRILNSLSNGSTIINNIQIYNGTTYLFQVRADGYLYNCIQTNKLMANQQSRFSVSLVPNLDPSEQLKISLHHETKTLNLELGAAFNTDSESGCSVSYFNSQCGGLIYKQSEVSKSGPSRVIVMHKLGMYKYLFYVKMVPLELRNILNNPGLQMTSAQSQELLVQDRQMLDAQVVVNIYSQNSKYPQARYNMPVNLTEEFFSAPLGVTWLAFCLDGSIGFTTVTPVQHFWAMGSSKSNNFWERSAANVQSVPDPSICEALYKQNDE